MLSPWIAFGLFCIVGFADGQNKETTACFRTPHFNILSLSCPSNTHIFILKMLYGSKPLNSTCSSSSTPGSCCQLEPSDCVTNYTDLQFGLVYTNHDCWNSTSCMSQAQQGDNVCPGHPKLSTFAVADYSCLGSDEITAFHCNTTITAPAVAVHYDSADVNNYPVVRGDNQTWHCQVDTADYVQRQADVILVNEGYETSSTSGCSSVGWSGGPFLPCVSDFQYTSFNNSTPFRVSVRVEAAHRLPSGWAVVRAQDGSNLTVTCGYRKEPSPTTSSCPAGAVEGRSQKAASGCYEVPGCPSLSLTCSADERLFPVRAQYGRLPSNCTCSTTAACADSHLPGDSKCFSDYSMYHFRQLYHGHNCWNVASCQVDAEQGDTACGNSTFSVLHYSCLRGEDITTFADNTTITAPAVAIHFDSRDITSYTFDKEDTEYKIWHCQVDTADCVQRQADVILVREEHGGGHKGRTSSVGRSGGGFLEFSSRLQYKSLNITTPLRVSVRVGNRRYPDGWAVVRTHLSVTCGYTSTNKASRSTCPGETMPTTKPGMRGSTESPAMDSKTGAVVGGVVAAVLVLVVATVGVFLFLRRHRHNRDDDTKPPDNSKTSMNMPLASVASGHASSLPASDAGLQGLAGDLPGAVADPDGDYTEVEVPEMQKSHAAAFGVHGNGRRPSQDPDYGILGEKKTQSAKPATTYGHLGKMGAGWEDTDYSYDHLSRRQQSAPVVIDSDYDTAALHVTSEGNYNVIDFQKNKQRIITGSAYDVAEVITSQNAEGNGKRAEPSIHIGMGEARGDVTRP